MKKIFFLFVVIAAFLVAIPAFAENTGPPSIALSVDYENYSTKALDVVGPVAAIPMVSVVEYATESNPVMTSANTVDSALSSKYHTEYVVKSIALAALMSCAIVALVSYLKTARHDIFDLRDRKHPMPMDQTSFA